MAKKKEDKYRELEETLSKATFNINLGALMKVPKMPKKEKNEFLGLNQEQKDFIVNQCVSLINKGLMHKNNLVKEEDKPYYYDKLEQLGWNFFEILEWLNSFIYLTNGRQTPTDKQ